jgi:hypothetical protein
MATNIKIIECISNISGIDVALQRIKIHWINESESNPFRREATESIYLKLGIVSRELAELRRLAKKDDHLNRILLTLEPFTKEMDYYQGGIKSYRDRYLAHYNRGNNYKFQPVSDILTPLLILPGANAEVELLIILTHFFSDMLIHFYRAEWSGFQKNLLDKLETSIVEFGNTFIPRTAVKIEENIAEVNELAVQYRLTQSGEDLIIIEER